MNEETPVFVGRTRELAILDEILGRTLRGQGGVVVILGEAGGGKSRLVKQFIRLVQARPEEQYQMIVAAAALGDSRPEAPAPYLLFEELTASLVSKGEPAPGSHVISDVNAMRLRRAFDLIRRIGIEVAKEALGLLVPWLDLGLDLVIATREWLMPSPRPDHFVSPEAVTARLVRQYTRFLEQVSQRYPLILWLDDMHFADAASCQLLWHLGRRASKARWLLIATARPHALDSEHPFSIPYRELKRSGAIVIDLDLRDTEAHRAFVNAFLDGNYPSNTFDDSFRHDLARRTAGNPLFVDHLLKLAKHHDWIRQDEDGRWVQEAALRSLRLPDTAEAALDARWQDVEHEDDRQILRVGAVEGWSFTIEVVAEILRRDVGEIADRLHRELDQHHGLVARGSDTTPLKSPLHRYHFRHGLIRDVIYREHVAPVNRQVWHGRIGEVKHDLWGERWQEIAVELAEHFRKGGRWQRYVEAASVIADRALRSGSPIESVEWSEEILEICKKTGNRTGEARTLIALADIAWGQDRYEDARDYLQAARMIGDEIGADGLTISALFGLARLARRSSRYAEADKWYQEATSIGRGTSEEWWYDSGEAHAQYGLAQTARSRAAYSKACEHYRKALSVFVEAGDEISEAWTSRGLARALEQLRQYEEAWKWCRRALNLFCMAEYPRGEGWAMRGLGNIALHTARYKKAGQLYLKAHSIFERLGDQRGQGWSLWGLGQVAYEQADHHETGRRYEEALRLFRSIGDDPSTIRVLCDQGQLELTIKQPGEAAKRYARAVAIARTADLPHLLASALAGQLHASILGGDLEAAIGAAQGLLEVQRPDENDSPIWNDIVHWISLAQALQAIQTGTLETASSHLRTALQGVETEVKQILIESLEKAFAQKPKILELVRQSSDQRLG